MVFGRMNPFGRSSQGDTEAEGTQSENEAQGHAEAEAASADERPGIADKVRFWEEQDRINRELIPRVLKQNELLSAHVASHEEVRLQTTSLNSRLDELAEQHQKAMAELEERTDTSIASANSRIDEMAEQHQKAMAELEERTDTSIASANSRIDEMAERHQRAMAELEARTAAEVRSSNRFALAVSMASAGIAALAVLLAFVY